MQDFTPPADSEDIELSESADFPDFEPSFSGNAYMRTLYLAEQGTVLSKEGERFILTLKGQTIKEIPSIRVDIILIFGAIQITTPTLQFCLSENIPIIFLSGSGKYYGTLESTNKTSVLTHKRQFDYINNREAALALARTFIKSKIHNQRVVLQRYGKRRAEISLAGEIAHLDILKERAAKADSRDKLFGIEGVASQEYFTALRKIIPEQWAFRKRTKQPPKDPVNSMLSFGYTLLFYNIYAFVAMHGLHPYVGFLHSMRQGHPALVSDLLEELRAPVIDSLVLNLIVREMIKPADFKLPDAAYQGCLLSDEARKTFIRAFESKMNTVLSNPSTGAKTTYRRLIEYKVLMLKHYLEEKVDEYEPFTIR